MTCVNGNSNFRVGSFINDNQRGGRVVSGNEMKILGYYFDSRATVDKHLEETGRKLRKRLRLLRHLTKTIKCKEELVDCYTCFLRPVVEYCSNVFSPMLNKKQSDFLENLQYAALRIIFGYEYGRDELINLAGIPLLSTRRGELFKKFCLKTHKNQRFREKWLKERTFTGPTLRPQQIIQENYSRTDRLYKSPLFTMRRTLNDLLVD